MQRFVTPLAETTDQQGFGYAYGVNVGDEGGRRVVWDEGVINGFSTYLAWYPDHGVTIACSQTARKGPTSSGPGGAPPPWPSRARRKPKAAAPRDGR